MKRLIFAILALFLCTTSFAKDYPEIPPYEGDNPAMPKLSRWGEIQALAPKVDTPEKKAKLEDAKQRFRNALHNYENMRNIIKKNNSNQAAAIKQYEHIFDRLWEIYKDNTVTTKTYDKEFVKLLSENLKHQYDYWVSVYKEQGSDIFLRKVKEVNRLRNLLKNEEVIVNQ